MSGDEENPAWIDATHDRIKSAEHETAPPEDFDETEATPVPTSDERFSGRNTRTSDPPVSSPVVETRNPEGGIWVQEGQQPSTPTGQFRLATNYSHLPYISPTSPLHLQYHG